MNGCLKIMTKMVFLCIKWIEKFKMDGMGEPNRKRWSEWPTMLLSKSRNKHGILKVGKESTKDVCIIWRAHTYSYTTSCVHLAYTHLGNLLYRITITGMHADNGQQHRAFVLLFHNYFELCILAFKFFGCKLFPCICANETYKKENI